ncbi:MAG TPA: hypothetical protein VFN67_12175 [Polyangiales bacterium]|nr:hypothetical protein [Polyangiales bacterium]
MDDEINQEDITDDSNRDRPILKLLPIERRPVGKTACETCELANWFATEKDLNAYCGKMYLLTWPAEPGNVVKLCDGQLEPPRHKDRSASVSPRTAAVPVNAHDSVESCEGRAARVDSARRAREGEWCGYQATDCSTHRDAFAWIGSFFEPADPNGTDAEDNLYRRRGDCTLRRRARGDARSRHV